MVRQTHIAYLLLMLATVWSSCNTDGGCDPNLICNTIQPTTAPMVLNVTIDAQNANVPLAVYLGNASDSSLYFRDTVSQDITYDLPISQRYSVIAKYRQGSLTIYAVDGGKTRLVTEPNCDQYCYTTNRVDLNLELIQ